MLRFMTKFAAGVLCLTAFDTSALAQGWGTLRSKKTTIRRLLPATVNLQNTRINVEAIPQGGVNPAVVEVLLTKVRTLIQSDNRFIFDNVNPTTVLRFVVTRYYVEQGTIAPANNVPGCTYYSGRIEASYTALDIKTKLSRDATNLVVTYPDSGALETKRGSTGNPFSRIPGLGGNSTGACANKGAASSNAAQDLLIDGLVQDLAQRAAPVEDSLELPLPTGKLANLSLLAEQQRWAALVEEAEKFPKFEKPNDEAFRAYLIGFGNECLAYDSSIQAAKAVKEAQGNIIPGEATKLMAKDREYRKDALSFADKSVIAYNEARRLKPGEQEFNLAQGRAEKAQTLFAAIAKREKDMDTILKQTGGDGSVGGGGGGGGKSTPDPAPPPPPTLSTDDELLDLCNKKVPTEIIVEWVQANRTKLTFGPGNAQGLVKLSQACGANAVPIRNAMKGVAPAPAPEPPPPAAPAPKVVPAAKPRATGTAAPPKGTKQ